MAKSIIASELIVLIREKGMIPDNITDEDILRLVNEEMSIKVVDTILELHEEHLVVPAIISPYKVSSEGTHYIIPTRAIGSKLRNAFYMSGTNQAYELSRIDIDEMGDFKWTNGYGNYGADIFYVRGDEIIVINPSTHGNTNLTAYFHISPNTIVLEESCAKITDIDKVNGVIQFDSIPKEFSQVQEFDFVMNKNPNKILGIDISGISVNINTRTVQIDPSMIPDRLSVGDWLCEAGTSPYPNMPLEMHPYVAQCTVVSYLESINDTEGLNNAVRKLVAIEKSVQRTLDDRVEGAPRKIKNRFSTLNSGKYFSRRRRNF